jgi:hypothetical protein
MVAFQIEVNGEPFGTAGADDLSVLTAMVSAFGKLGPNSSGSHQREHDPHLELRVGGLTSRAEPADDEHLDWINHTLRTGDVVTVRVVDATTVDAPTVSNPARTDADYQLQYEWAKNFYFDNRDKFDGK